MAKNGNKIMKSSPADPETLQKAFDLQRIGNRAVKKAQEENRRLGIPNWYSVGDVIISDQEILRNKKGKNSK